MTWKYNIADDGSSMDVIDHKGNIIKTIQNDGSGFKIPDDILQVMRQKAENHGPGGSKSGNAGNSKGVSPYGWKVMAEINAKDIKEKK